MTDTTMRLQLDRPHPQGELFLLRRQGDHYEALVYNTIGQNLCPADIVPDELANMYQGCIGGVNNFDPWQ